MRLSGSYVFVGVVFSKELEPLHEMPEFKRIYARHQEKLAGLREKVEVQLANPKPEWVDGVY